jgi:hypothetical protein
MLKRFENGKAHLARGWWISRTFDESEMCLLGGLFLGSLENSFAEKIEAASAIHLSLDEFQAMHLALRLAVAPL